MSDKCPMCDSATTEVIDPDSADFLKVRCEACGYENVEFARTSNENPNRGKSQNNKTPFVRRANMFVVLAAIVLALTTLLFLPGFIKGMPELYKSDWYWGSRKIFLIFPLLFLFELTLIQVVLSLVNVVEDFNQRLKQLEARQADED